MRPFRLDPVPFDSATLTERPGACQISNTAPGAASSVLLLTVAAARVVEQWTPSAARGASVPF
jgi:hypothetical protein